MRMNIFLRVPRIRVNPSSGLKIRKKNGFLCFVRNKVYLGESRGFSFHAAFKSLSYLKTVYMHYVDEGIFINNV